MAKLKEKKLTINSLLSSLIYPKKKIDQKAILYKFIHYSHIDKRTLMPSAGAFRDEELSCDWNRYSTPQQTRDLIGRQYSYGTNNFKNKNHFFICRLEVEKLLDLDPKQIFEHDPIFKFPVKMGFPNNRAHSLIIGKKDQKEIVKARGQIVLNSKWLIFDEAEFKKLITQ